MEFIKRTFPFLLGIFLISVLVRLPLLDRPLSRHHEFCTATALRTIQIWYDNGIEKYGFNPVTTYNNEADKFINNYASASGKMVDAEGNYYYVSHPPFAYYFPYAIFKLLHVRPSVMGLQTLNLCLHFLSGLFIYFIVCLLSFRRSRSYPYRSAIVAFAIYTFLPATLWFQGNVYMSDMAVHTLFIIGVYIALKMIIREKFNSPKYILSYILILGLMIYTSWLGIFFAFGVLVYSLLRVQGTRGFRTLIWATALLPIILLPLMAYQYSQINGLEAYLSENINRYMQRGSLVATNNGLLNFVISYLWLLKTLLYNYFVNYTIVYVALVLFIWVAISRKKLKIVFSENGYRFMWLSITPVVLLHLFFLNYSVHDFTVLYASLFFSVLAGILYEKIKKSGAFPLRTMQISLTIIIAIMAVQFYVINPPEFLHMRTLPPYKALGERIKAEAAKDEVVFANVKDLEPQVIYYAERNIKTVTTKEEALEFLKTRNWPKGILFTEDAEGKVVSERIAL